MRRALRLPPLPGLLALLLGAAWAGAPPAVAGERAPRRLVTLLEQGQALFSQAADSEQPEEAQALYQRALDRYLAVLQEGGVRNSRLLYDIGNTYFLLGDLGRAVLYLRRAELLDPADRNLQHNLEFVRSQRADRLAPNQVSAAARTVLFWHYLLPLALKVVARKGDGTAYQSSFVDPLHAGTEFRLLEVRAGWYRIRLSDGRTAWIPASAAELVRPTG
jgi:tetratricopeptide (TPR) repeat protein